MIGNHPTLKRTAAHLASAALLSCIGVTLFSPSSASAQLSATLTDLHDFNGTDGATPIRGPILGADGNYYGAGYSGGDNNVGVIYKLTPDGDYSVLHSFPATRAGANPDGISPRVLIQGSDGNLYGVCRGGGKVSNTPAGGGTFFRLGLDGTFTRLYDFDTGRAGVPLFPSALVEGSDGNFYGLSRDGGTSGINEGTYFRITPDGILTQLFEFKGGDGPGYSPEAQLCVGTDGNFYGVTTASGSSGGAASLGTIFKATIGGTVTRIHAFNAGSQGSGGGAQELVQGTDGFLYGVSPAGGTHDYGDIYKCSTTGTFTVLHNFDDPRTDGAVPSALTVGADGNLYGSTTDGFPIDPNSIVDNGNGSYFQITPSGTFTTLVKTQGQNGSPARPNGKLLHVGNNVFIGGTAAGGPGDYGTLVSLAVTGGGGSTHPAFFAGEASLGGGAYYLQFASGNPFGYYSYLDDPAYIYHFDLGYEYVFDAADGKAGVYFYDFKSGTFFYTSPSFPFPYLYDFTLNTVLYYFPNPTDPTHYNTDGVRYFVRLDTGEIFSK